MILACKRETVKRDVCCRVVCAIPCLAGGNCWPLFLIFFITLIGFDPESKQCLFWWFLIAAQAPGSLHQLGLHVAAIPACSTCTPGSPSFVCVSFGPHLEAEWRWRERRRRKKTPGKKRGRRSKPVEQVKEAYVTRACCHRYFWRACALPFPAFK